MPHSRFITHHLQHQVKAEQGSMSSSEVRMTPRPAKAPAWSVPPIVSSPLDDPSSCSDNASDNSDKMENLQQQTSSSNKNRKRKIGNNAFGVANGNGQDNIQKEVHCASSTTNNSGGHGSLWADAESLAADFDGSLSGLGGDLSTASYDMSEALLALPSLYHHHHRNANSSQQQGFLKEAGLTPLSAAHLHGGSTASLPGNFHFEPHSTSPCHSTSAGGMGQASLDCERRFQYVLAAATSTATKMNEETLTYLNQGQPYEIKLKKLGDLTAYRGVVFRSVVRLCFHDRRLQFSEREQIISWEDTHKGDRILHVDLPLSYGVNMLPHSAELPTNKVSFLWEPLKEVGLYVKVNCISTEFTPKKHGGEKGVPFRMLIETFSHPDNVRLHASACQVKVFKLKGADRKHKQDREKILKKTPVEQAKLQPSYDCTVLSDISLESLDSPPPAMQNNGNGSGYGGGGGSAILSPGYCSDQGAGGESPENQPACGTSNGVSGHEPHPPTSANNYSPTNYANYFSAHFSSESVRRWLIRNRFSSTKALWDFSGVDLLRLTKEEFIEMCGLAEGIRLYNALHYKITFYVTLNNTHENRGEGRSDDSPTLFHPLCLSSPSLGELAGVLGSLFHTQSGSDPVPVERLFLLVTPPNSNRIRVLLTEELLSTLRDQTAFKAIKSGLEVCLEVIE